MSADAPLSPEACAEIAARVKARKDLLRWVEHPFWRTLLVADLDAFEAAVREEERASLRAALDQATRERDEARERLETLRQDAIEARTREI